MFRDARRVETGSEITTDLCVIGGGAAGITIALGVKDARFSTLLVEAGGFEPDGDTQAVYNGSVDSDVLPRDYLRSSRLRQFGGTTNHWGGHSVVINRHIFEPRDAVPGGAWPFGSDVLRPYYARASQVLKKPRAVPERWDPEPFAGMLSMERYGGTAEPHRRLGPAYREELDRAQLQVMLHASVTALNTDASGRRVRDVTIKTLSGNEFSVHARVFVLATGAIENARLLLLPTAEHRNGLGNDADLVGRFFADHFYHADQIIETTPLWPDRVGPFFTIAPALQNEHRVPEVGLLRRRPDTSQDSGTGHTVSALAALIDESSAPVRTAVNYLVEPLPDRENRVMLSEERDPFGQPRTALRFNVSSAMRDGFARAVELLATLAGRNGIGRVKRTERERFLFGSHHMFTTKMHADPSRGVVDADGRLHSIANLFVAGSSVFPSSGCGNPTYPLIALSARLADHLVEGIERRAFD